MELKGIPMVGVIVMPNYPEEYVPLVRIVVQGIEVERGEVHFLVSCPESFRICFENTSYQMASVTDNMDRSGRVINNDFVATHSEEVILFTDGDLEFDTELSVLRMKMRSIGRKLTAHSVTVRSNVEIPDDIPF